MSNKGERLRTEGLKMFDASDRLLSEGSKLPDGDAVGKRLVEASNRLWGEGVKFLAAADRFLESPTGFKRAKRF